MKRIPLKEQTNRPLQSNRHQVKKEIMKILKELRRAINGNADYCKKELETIKEEPGKIRKLIC